MKKDEKKSKFPDLNKDGEVTQADILMGRGVGTDKDKKETKKMMGGGMAKKGYAKGGMSKKGYAKGGMTKKGYAKGGMTKMEEEEKKDTNLPYKAGGSVMKKKGYAKGGMAKKGYSKGGATKKGSAKGGKKSKVRGAGIARKGVRPAKMR
jgi:hypothetical protein